MTNIIIFWIGYEVKLKFKFSEFSASKEINYIFMVNKKANDSTYNVIIGYALLQLLKTDILYSKSHLV